MSQRVASTSTLPAPPMRSSSTSRRLPGAWARPTLSSGSHARRRVDVSSSSDAEAQGGGARAFQAWRLDGERARPHKRPRASLSLNGDEPPARTDSSSARRPDHVDQPAAGAARPAVEVPPRREPAHRSRADAAAAPFSLVGSRAPVAPTAEHGERHADRPTSSRTRRTPPPSATRPFLPTPSRVLDRGSSTDQRGPPGLPNLSSASYPPHPHHPRPVPAVASTSSTSITHPSAASSSRSSATDVLPRLPDSQSTSWASSQAATSSFTPSYIRDRYAAPSSSAPPKRRRRPPLLEPKRGPAPFELLFDGQDVPPGSTRLPYRPPPRPPASALEPAAAAAPARRHIPPSLLFPRKADAEARERARREREAGEAEERRRRSVWTAAAQACGVAVAVKAPPLAVAAAHNQLEEPQRAPELPRETAAPPKLTLEHERELQALFSPPMSPLLPRPASSAPELPPTIVVPPPPLAAPARPVSPELFMCFDNSPRQTRQPLLAFPPSPSCPPSTTFGERADRCRGRSTSQSVAGADATTTDSAAALSALELGFEPEGSPELVMGMSVEREKPAPVGGRGPPRRGKQMAASAKGEGMGKGMGKKRAKGKAWMTLEPEDTWWTRDLDEERAVVESAPVDWVTPEQAGRRALEHAEPGQQSLELTIRELVLPTSALPRSALETGRCLVDLHISLRRTLEREPTSLLLCERGMRVGLVVERGESADPASRTFRLEHCRPFPLHVDLASFGARASSLSLSVAINIGKEPLVAQHVVAAKTPFSPCAALLPFRPGLHAETGALVRLDPSSRTSAPCVVGLSILLAAQPVPRRAPPSSTDISSILSARLERLALHREAPSGVWVPDAVAVRAPTSMAPHEKRMPRLDGGAERPTFDFLTKVPHVPGELVRLFAYDSIETTRAALSSKDEEISRSSMTRDEKLLTRMQVRWCLVNPSPPTVYHRERACWVHYAPLILRFALRPTLVLHLLRHLLAHKLVTEAQLREIVRAVDREVERVEAGERQDYDEWRRGVEWERTRS